MIRLDFGYPWGGIEIRVVLTGSVPNWEDNLPEGARVIMGPIYTDGDWRALVAIPVRGNGPDLGEALIYEGSARVLNLLLSSLDWRGRGSSRRK